MSCAKLQIVFRKLQVVADSFGEQKKIKESYGEV